MSDRLTAWVRTVVPTAWSALVAWLVSLGLPAAVTDAVAGLADTLIVPVVLAAVYALLRWVEPRLPRWLAVLLLGSSRPPVYDPVAATTAGNLAVLDSMAHWGRDAEEHAKILRST
ncbi:hypothetical protein [Actinophytocola sediminis]